MSTILRKAAAGALSVVAKGMSVGSKVTGRVADLVRDGSGAPGTRGRATAEKTAEALEVVGQDRQTVAARRVAVSEPPTEPVADAPAHVRTYETHVEELADKSAAEVIAAVPGLATEELGRLYEHEAANKKRKTVLAAIERAADPNATEPMPEAGGVPTGSRPG